jgi:hypothetical protein
MEAIYASMLFHALPCNTMLLSHQDIPRPPNIAIAQSADIAYFV